jgi:hypothetical protein
VQTERQKNKFKSKTYSILCFFKSIIGIIIRKKKQKESLLLPSSLGQTPGDGGVAEVQVIGEHLDPTVQHLLPKHSA